MVNAKLDLQLKLILVFNKINLEQLDERTHWVLLGISQNNRSSQIIRFT